MKRRYCEEAINQLREAIKNDDLDMVKELIESGSAGISNIECVYAVNSNSLKVLEYIVERECSAVRVLSYGLIAAVRAKHKEAIEIFLTSFRENKRKYKYNDLDSVVLESIKESIIFDENATSSTEALQNVKFIIDMYYGEE